MPRILTSGSIRLPLTVKERDRREGGPRILAYCASNVGLGHFGRLSRILARVREQRPDTSVLFVSDIRPHVQLSHGDGLALLKLPGFRFEEGSQFEERPEGLDIPSAELRELRARQILAAGLSFQPDVLALDTNPHGKRDEVLPLLKFLRRQGRGRCRSLLFLRDIPCPPGERFKFFAPDRKLLKQARHYDRILIAGDPRFFDCAREYGWPDALLQKTEYLGFVVPRTGVTGRAELFERFPGTDPEAPCIVAGFGGGWEAHAIAPRLIEGLELYNRRAPRPAQLLLFLGPAVDPEQRLSLRELACKQAGVVLQEFSSDFPEALHHADMAVLLAGSSAFQLLDRPTPLLLYARDYKSREQQLRAERLAELPAVRVADREHFQAEKLAADYRWALEEKHPPRENTLPLDGLEKGARAVLDALETSSVQRGKQGGR